MESREMLVEKQYNPIECKQDVTLFHSVYVD